MDAVLGHLDLPATPLPISPARGPPQPDLGFDVDHALEIDQTPPFNPEEPVPVRDLEFDQSRGG